MAQEARMVAATENAPCTRASFTSSPAPRSSGSSRKVPASLVAAHAANAVDNAVTIRFCASLLNFLPPPARRAICRRLPYGFPTRLTDPAA